MKSCPSISVDSSASSSGTQSATGCRRDRARYSTANVKAPGTFGNTTDTQFSTFSVHTWLSQAFLVNKHLSRRCLCTTQHCRDRSRQFSKTLCTVLLTSQLSFKCRILSRQHSHLLLQRSRCIFHFWDRVGSHAKVESSRSEGFHGQHSATRGPRQLRDSHKLSPTRDFASRPTNEFHTRSENNRQAPLVPRFATSSTRSANKERVRHRIQQRSATMFAKHAQRL